MTVIDQKLFERFSTVVEHVLNLHRIEISGEMNASDVPGWNSLNHVLIVFELENEFGIELSPEEVADLPDFDAIVGMIVSKVSPP